MRFQHAFTASGCIFKVITVNGSNHYNYFENTTARNKRSLKTRVTMQLKVQKSPFKLCNIRLKQKIVNSLYTKYSCKILSVNLLCQPYGCVHLSVTDQWFSTFNMHTTNIRNEEYFLQWSATYTTNLQ